MLSLPATRRRWPTPHRRSNRPAARAAADGRDRRLPGLRHRPRAYAIAPDWTITGWNAAYAALNPNIATEPAADRNLLWLVFTDPYLRTQPPDSEVTSDRFVAEFRAVAGPRLGDPAIAGLIERLEAGDAFRTRWDATTSGGSAHTSDCSTTPGSEICGWSTTASRGRTTPDLVYTPVDDTVTPARLREPVTAT